MRITPDTFRNGGEVDHIASYGVGHEKGRLSTRYNPETQQYEVYVRWHWSKKEEVLCTGDLMTVGRFANQARCNYGIEEDQYEEA